MRCTAGTMNRGLQRTHHGDDDEKDEREKREIVCVNFSQWSESEKELVALLVERSGAWRKIKIEIQSLLTIISILLV
jgi:hypothetical protein